LNKTESDESSLGRAYRRLYESLCGKHPRLRPVHFQWLSSFYLNRSLSQILPTLGGRVLDVGCGAKPYRNWFGPTTKYVGLDVAAGPAVDVVVAFNEPWPLPDASFDVLLCSQVLEHVEDLGRTLTEINRVTRPGGVVCLTVPFIYNEHGAPHDFRRFTAYGASALFPASEVVLSERQGGIGSTIMILILNWVDACMNKTFATRLLKPVLLPIWLIACLLGNLLALVIDSIDKTSGFYHNLVLVIRRSS
jgi:SAM-dependent methyltransferase